MRSRLSRIRLAGLLLPLLGLGMSGNGCPSATGLPASGTTADTLAGVWTTARGILNIDASWTTGGGGEIKQTFASQMLESLDPTAFPSILSPAVQQWNDNLAALNAKLDAAFPTTVVVTFPQYGVVRFTDPNDSTHTIDGGIDGALKYIFIGDVSGSAHGDSEGGVAAFQAASIQGSFDRSALTTQGTLARTLTVASTSGGGSFTVQLSLTYTGQRTGPVPSQNSGGG